MFSNVRWRIALWFAGLSTMAYVLPTCLAMFLFYANLTAALDGELKVFLASFGHAISVVDGKPVLRDWARVVQTVPARSLVNYQLFDRDGKLLESHGDSGIPALFQIDHEVSNGHLTFRTQMTALKERNQTIGFLQVQSPTKPRDDAMRELAFVTAIFAPLVLFGLSCSSYLVSEKATASTKQTNLMLRRFLADASHELYTPLTIVQAANESLQRAVQPSGLGALEFEIAESALERMESMIEDLKLLSSMEDPAVGATKEIVYLSELLADVITEFKPKFLRKNVDIKLSDVAQCRVLGDGIALHRLFANIIENALRYTDPTGQVKIQMTEEAHLCKVSVTDTGIGIPGEYLPNIFDRFYRVDASRSRNSGGSGLGLAIALALAQSHNGKIEAQSEHKVGSTFTVILPRAT